MRVEYIDVCECMCVCMYVCVRLFVCLCLYFFRMTCVFVTHNVRMCICMCICMCAYFWVCVFFVPHKSVQLCVRVFNPRHKSIIVPERLARCCLIKFADTVREN